MILITGANGHLGDLTIKFLDGKIPSDQIAALVRTAEKGEALKAKGIDVRLGDYADKASLKAALAGIDTLLLISSGSLEDRVGQHKNVIEAAKEAGVKQILYTSVVKPSAESKFVPGIDHFYTEVALKESGIAYTMLRNTFYFEVLPMFLADSLVSGNWFYPSNGAKINLASRIDMAEAIANILANPAGHANKIYDLAAPVSHTLAEVGELIAKATGKPFTYHDIPVDAYKDALTKAGVPAGQLPFIVGIAEAITLSELDQPSMDLESLIGKKPLELGAFVATLVKS